MKDMDKTDYDLSLHEFKLIYESNSNNLSDKDFIKKQKELLKISGINQSLNNKRLTIYA